MANLPKPADRRARRNKGGPEFQVIEMTPGSQPPLPERAGGWSPMTQETWENIGLSEIARDFTPVQWDLLKVAMLMHEAIFVDGQYLRVDQYMSIMSKFPFSPKDMQALRIQRLTGDHMENKVDSEKEKKKSAAKEHFSGLRIVG